MTRHRPENGFDRNNERGERGRVVAFIGGKGGIGKSSVAVNTAIALARRGLRTILLDAAAQFAHVDIMMDERLPADLPIGRDDSVPIERSLTAGPDGLRVARYAGLTEQSIDRGLDTDYKRTMDCLRNVCDVVVVDCGSGIGERGVNLALLADCLVLATTPEPTALTDAYATAKVLVKRGYRGLVGLVVNMVRSRRDTQRLVRRFRRAAAEFLGLTVQQLGIIPFDRHVVAAARQRRPVLVGYPHCAASASIERISRALPLGRREKPRGAGFWVHAASLFL